MPVVNSGGVDGGGVDVVVRAHRLGGLAKLTEGGDIGFLIDLAS